MNSNYLAVNTNQKLCLKIHCLHLETVKEQIFHLILFHAKLKEIAEAMNQK